MPEANNDFIKVEYDSSTIADILERINSEEENGIFLPYVQRDFVWDKERIYSLLDSLMRGYPIGLIRIWETTLAVNYREFERYYRFNLANNNFFPGNANNKITKQYVLDGQQRLQSLYIAMHGSYDRKVIFFNLRSNKEEKYEFEFHSNTFTKDGWINVHDFLENPAIINELEQTPDDEMFKNAKKLHDIFKTNKNIRIEKLASDNLTDVANIFLLSNAGGVVLEPNDLIMATINAKWVTEPAKFTELINMIRGLGFGDKPKDLIIQSCYAVFLKDTGKTDGKTITKKFKTAEVIATLHQNIGKISASIVDVLTFVSKLDAVRKFKTAHYNPIFILIAYRYTHGHDVWNTNKDNAKKFLLTYLFSIDKPTQAIVRELLAYVTSVAGRNFDMEQIRTIFENNNRRFEFNPNALLDINISMTSNIAPLILYLIYYGQDNHGFNPETMTVKDHIFPQSALENIRDNRGRRVYSNNEVDSILNCELLTQDKNSNKHKGDQLPDVYFTNTNDFNGSDEELNNFLNLHAIPTRNPQQVNIWDIVYYIDFLNARKKLLIQRITANFGELVNDGDGVSKDERRLIRNLNKNISSSTSLTLDDD